MFAATSHIDQGGDSPVGVLEPARELLFSGSSMPLIPPDPDSSAYGGDHRELCRQAQGPNAGNSCCSPGASPRTSGSSRLSFRVAGEESQCPTPGRQTGNSRFLTMFGMTGRTATAA